MAYKALEASNFAAATAMAADGNHRSRRRATATVDAENEEEDPNTKCDVCDKMYYSASLKTTTCAGCREGGSQDPSS